MIKIGMMIGNRYEILEKIGTGGMSDVYKAKCHKLNRFVAVKVLKQEFGENENFVSKFRVEAQAAAGLMHPNIVNVYDVGEENSIHYIVMELVEGITLKKYIEKKARLTYKEAVSIAIQVSMGIEAAHNNHIIHRDIKPQNIIISKDGKVKVTDFGIAKAATSNTITSNVMGSVHYTSPEQARGGYSDEKSDVYSLGITLFEMLTGRVPFNGDTTVAIAIKHIQEEMPSPKEYVSEIPAGVEGIVLKCCQKSPDRRYQNMQELIGDLKQSLLNPDEDFVSMNQSHMEAGTRMLSDADMEQIKRQSAYRNFPEYQEEEDSQTFPADEDELYDEEAEPDGTPYGTPYGEEDYEYDSRAEKITTFFAVLAGIIIIVIFFTVVFMLFKSQTAKEKPNGPILSEESEPTSSQAPYKDMPSVVGMSVEDARNDLIGMGIMVEVAYAESDTIDAGVVMDTSVAAGSPVQVGSSVTLTASAGKRGENVPNVTGSSYEEASAELTGAGFLVNKTESYSDTIEKNIVIYQKPDGGNKAPKGSVITVNVSLGKEQKMVRVPKLVEQTEEDGTLTAIENNLRIGSVSKVYSEEVAEGLICYQSYSHGSYVEPDTAIDIKVSQGPQPVTYKYEADIAAPSAKEAPDYPSGADVKVVLQTDDGKVRLDTTVKYENFPYAVKCYGLATAGGTVTLTYRTAAGEEKSVTRKVEFVKE